ncbi:MAG: twin-arginine translocation signal domain-containing protein [Eggerthellaceae bacterium]|nr:twin-arginine translocation signal domain-containing protein [Eggerthellaceae bacterium]
MPYIKNTYNLQNSSRKSERFDSRPKKRERVSKRRGNGFLDKELATFNKGFDPFTITRRHFLYGTTALAALIGVGSGIKIVSDSVKNQNAVSTLKVPASSFKLSDDLAQISNEGLVNNIMEAKLDYGTNCWCNSNKFTLALSPSAEGRPLNSIKFVYHSNANEVTVVERAINYNKSFEIFDARANDNGLVWVEANILDNHWILYGAELNSTGGISSPVELDSSRNDKQMPAICVAGNYAFWQLQPIDSSSAQECMLKKSSFNRNNTELVYSSKVQFACPPYPAKFGVVVCPRAATSSVIYQPTYIDWQANKIIDQLNLPSPIKPLLATYGTNGFSFCLDQIYKGSDGIGQLGTYTPVILGSDKNYNSTDWFRFTKTPVAAPVDCGSYYVVKSHSSICCIDFRKMNYFQIDPPVGCESYGDFIIQSGIVDHLVYTANVNHIKTDGSNEKYTMLCVSALT